jgi:cell division protein FtsB
MKYSSSTPLAASNLTSSVRSLSSQDERGLRAENEKLRQYLQDYESQIKDLESELSQLK